MLTCRPTVATGGICPLSIGAQPPRALLLTVIRQMCLKGKLGRRSRVAALCTRVWTTRCRSDAREEEGCRRNHQVGNTPSLQYRIEDMASLRGKPTLPRPHRKPNGRSGHEISSRALRSLFLELLYINIIMQEVFMAFGEDDQYDFFDNAPDLPGWRSDIRKER